MRKEKIKQLLIQHPFYRERSNKDLLLAKILHKEYPKLQEIEVHNLANILQEYGSMDRIWRRILEKDIGLRGGDYGDKKKLVDKKLQTIYND